MTDPAHDAQRRVLNRLRRAQGQLAAVITAVESSKPCREVVIQLAATSKALDRAGVMLVTTAMQECLTEPEASRAENGSTPAEFEKLFMLFA
ncbi:MAG TPA: metal-sensitive transcriptional regulator [Trueperaceae bacterium]|nr:metal-sensitive transcriptional regulator [Trueperaceae bacterium]